MAFSSAFAQMAINVEVPDGFYTPKKFVVTGKNVSRGEGTLVLYDRSFGPNTRTNPHGVEIIAEKMGVNENGDAVIYKIKKITNVWECQKNEGAFKKDGNGCGNADIPKDGVVLSATGGLRNGLLNWFHEGDVFALREEWFQKKQMALSVVDPNRENNPGACGFPGCRGSNQLIVYTQKYAQDKDTPKTGTNEYGFEVTVVNGIVVAQEGSDSVIPNTENSFVISGHGRMRDWLIQNAPLGTKVALSEDARTLLTEVDYDTYRYQLVQRLNNTCCRTGCARNLCSIYEKAGEQADSLHRQAHPEEAVRLLVSSLENLNRDLWAQYPAFPQTAIKGIWHRPVETTAKDIGETLDYIKQAGLNTVFLETFFHGYTIFPSDVYTAFGIEQNQNPKFAGADLLDLWTKEAHKRGMKVHIWFQTFYTGTKANNPPGVILAKYPQWANVQYSALYTKQDPKAAKKPAPVTAGAEEKVILPPTAAAQGVTKEAPPSPVSSTLELGAYFIDPANPEARGFVLSLINEIVSKYDVDGFQLDYIRYPGSFPQDRYSYLKTTWGYTDLARQEFKTATGVDPAYLNDVDYPDLWQQWENYKIAKVNSFVEEAQKLIRTQAVAKNKSILISAAVFPGIDTAKLQKHQDWETWAQNGWVDFLAPMTLTSAVKVVGEDTQKALNTVEHKVPIISGVFGAFNNNTAEQLLDQIEAARVAGASGFNIFDTAHLTGRMVEALRASQDKTNK